MEYGFQNTSLFFLIQPNKNMSLIYWDPRLEDLQEDVDYISSLISQSTSGL